MALDGVYTLDTPRMAPLLSRDLSRRVAILLSTYNGAAFVREQLESLIEQSHDDWVIYWRDDGSADDTPDAVGRVIASLPPGRVVKLPDGQRLGPIGSFVRLLRRAYADGMTLFAFADQDDVWLPEKLAWAVAALRGVRAGVPGLYFARQMLVDSRLRQLGISFPLRHPAGFPAALTQNIAAGCTIVMNREAAALVAGSEPPAVCLHDWWSYIVVAANGGSLLPDSRAAVLYRQHSANHVGVPRNLVLRGWRALRRGPGPYMRVLRANVHALEAHPELLSPTALVQVQELADVLRGNWRDRLGLLHRMPQLRRQGRLETAVFWLWFLLPSRMSA